MKRLFAIFISCLFYVQSSAQVNIDDVWSEGAKWVYTYTFSPGQHTGSTSGYAVTIGKDSTFLGNNYRLVYHQKIGEYFFNGTKSNNNPPKSLAGGVRVDGLKVYFIYTSQPNPVEQLIYDFDLKVGDTVKWKIQSTNPGLKNSNVIEAIDSVLLSNNKYAKRFIFDTLKAPLDLYWIEGIGSNVTPFGNEEYAKPRAGYMQNRTKCYDAPSFYYRFSGNLQDGCFYIPPNAISDVETGEGDAVLYINANGAMCIKNSEAINTLTVYDITGRIKYTSMQKLSPGQHALHTPYEPGIYFIRIEFSNGAVKKEKIMKY